MLESIKKVTRKKVDKKKFHQELVPKQKDLLNKTCFMGLSFDVIYFLTLEYYKNNQEWFYDSSKYREISFAFNYNKIKDANKILEAKYLKRNNFFAHYYNFNDLDNLDILSGYESIVIGDIFNDFSVNNVKSLQNIDLIINKLISYGCKIYYLLPSFCYNGDKLYNANSIPDSESDLAIVSKHLFLDNYFSYLRNYKKIPIYRLIIPQYLNHKDYEFMAYQEDILRIRSSVYLSDQRQFFLTKFPFLFSNKLAEGLYKFSIESKPKNYVINSDVNLCLHDISTKYPLYDITKTKEVKFKKDIVVNNYTVNEYKEIIRNSFKRGKSVDKSYIDSIIDNENKNSFKEFKNY